MGVFMVAAQAVKLMLRGPGKSTCNVKADCIRGRGEVSEGIGWHQQGQIDDIILAASVNYRVEGFDVH